MTPITLARHGQARGVAQRIARQVQLPQSFSGA